MLRYYVLWKCVKCEPIVLWFRRLLSGEKVWGQDDKHQMNMYTKNNMCQPILYIPKGHITN